MVQFVKPLYLGTEENFRKTYVTPIGRGQSKYAQCSEIENMKVQAFKLNRKLSPVVHVNLYFN